MTNEKYPTEVDGVLAEPLNQYIGRIENLAEEKKGITKDIKEIYDEAKGNGYDPKIMRQIVNLRKLSKEDRERNEALVETYKQAVGLA